MTEFKTGDRVRHTLRDELGTVEIVEDGVIKVTFDNPTPKGRPSIGMYDEAWFRICPKYLVPAGHQ
jgi:hypothetical protein